MTKPLTYHPTLTLDDLIALRMALKERRETLINSRTYYGEGTVGFTTFDDMVREVDSATAALDNSDVRVSQ